MPTVRVIAANDIPNRCPKWNIATFHAGDAGNEWPTYTQGPTGPASPPGAYREVVAGATGTGPFNNGFKTIVIAGYTGPR